MEEVIRIINQAPLQISETNSCSLGHGSTQEVVGHCHGWLVTGHVIWFHLVVEEVVRGFEALLLFFFEFLLFFEIGVFHVLEFKDCLLHLVIRQRCENSIATALHLAWFRKERRLSSAAGLLKWHLII
jgi:hypothetical protein